MIISILSFFLVLIVTGIWIFFIYRGNGEFLDPSRVHSVVMSLGTTIGLSMGVILANLIDYHFFVSCLVGLALGYIIGKPFSLYAIVDGMVSGIMGGIMGVMIPMMVHLNPIWSVLFMDLVFVILMFFNLKLALLIKGKGRIEETNYLRQKQQIH